MEKVPVLFDLPPVPCFSPVKSIWHGDADNLNSVGSLRGFRVFEPVPSAASLLAHFLFQTTIHFHLRERRSIAGPGQTRPA